MKVLTIKITKINAGEESADEYFFDDEVARHNSEVKSSFSVRS